MNPNKIMRAGYVEPGIVNKLFGIEYTFNECDAKKKKKNNDALFRQVLSSKRRNRMIFDIIILLTVIIEPIFLFMFAQSMLSPEVLLNLTFRYSLIALAIPACGLPLFALFFKDNYEYFSEIKRDTLSTTAEKFLMFKNQDRKITDAKISFENNKAHLHLFYKDEDRKIGTITKTVLFDNFTVIKTDTVKRPLLSINEGVYYIPTHA